MVPLAFLASLPVSSLYCVPTKLDHLLFLAPAPVPVALLISELVLDASEVPTPSLLPGPCPSDPSQPQASVMSSLELRLLL